MTRLKVMTILGTRPEIIRLSRTMSLLDQVCEHKIVHTGQNYDYELNEIFFREMEIRKPDHFLGVGGGTLGQTLGKILAETERVIRLEQPDAVLILGDTNSAISAVIATRMKVPVYHMEAGNRSFDRNVPEETNRRLVDHIADFNLVYTEHARRHLVSEGLPHRRTFLTGSPMREVIDYYRPRIEASDVLARLGAVDGGYFVVSLHREENVDNSRRLSGLIGALNTLVRQYDRDVIVSTHPRTRKRIDALGDGIINPRVKYMLPFGFFDYNQLQRCAFCSISDSGTIAEEAAILQFPAVTPRDAIERPEAIDAGCIIVTGVEEEAVVRGVELATALFATRNGTSRHPIPREYSITDTSERVVALIVGTARLSNGWDGIRRNDMGE